jgi:hypothetical protein
MKILEYTVLSVEDISQDHYNKVCDFLNGLDIVWTLSAIFSQFKRTT